MSGFLCGGRMRACLAGFLAAVMLGACGGGGGGSGDDTPKVVTPIPDSLAITAPSAAEMASAVQFNQTGGTAVDFQYSWNFGDGAVSDSPSPSHAYAKGGDYQVTLKVTNGAGVVREVKVGLSISNHAFVAGLICSGEQSAAGWCWNSPQPTGNLRYDTFFVNPTLGWMVGEAGEILKTVNAGVAWARQNSGVNVSLYSVRFASADVGYVLGAENSLLRTNDGGASWKASTRPAAASSLPLLFYDANNLVLAQGQGGSSATFTSTDGGQTWRTLGYPVIGVSQGKILWSLRDGQVYRSADFGLNETRVLDLRPTEGTSSYRMQLLDSEGVLIQRIHTALVNGQGVVTTDWLRSRDSGASWQAVTPQGLPASLQASNLLAVNASDTLFISNYRSTDAGDTWSAVNWTLTEAPIRLGASVLVVKPFRSTAAISSDNGNTWAPMELPVPARLDHSDYSISTVQYFPTARVVIHVSAYSYGSIETDIGYPSTLATYVSTDMGSRWDILDKQTHGGRYCNGGPKLLAFMALGANRQLRVEDRTLKSSTDGGKTWETRRTDLGMDSPYCNYDADFQFASDKLGWLLAGASLYRTTDAGDSWSATPIGNDFASIQFIDDRLGWAVRYGAYPDRVLAQSLDGGVSWGEPAPLPSGVTDVRFQSATRGIALGSGRIHETRDGGKTWVLRYTSADGFRFSEASYADASTVWVLGPSGRALLSVDGGETWTAKVVDESALLLAVQFIDAQHGWIGGSQGEIFATVDGGKTWKRQVTGSGQYVSKLQFVDTRTGWVVGSSGGLLMTGTGGF